MARAQTTRSRSPGTPSDDATVDPALPQKKQARHRLIGAVTLCLAAAVVVPLVLEPEPTRSPSDVAVVIPSRDTPLPARSSVSTTDGAKGGADASRRARASAETPSTTAAMTPVPADAPPALEVRPSEAKVSESRAGDGSGAIPRAAAKTDPKADLKADPKADTQTDSKVDSQADAKSKGEAKAKGDSKADSKSAAKTDGKADAKTDAKPTPKADGAAPSRTEPKADARTDAKADSRGEAKSDTRAAPKADAKADPKSDARAAPKADPKKSAPTDEIEKLVDASKARPAAATNRKYALQVGAYSAETSASAAVDKLRAAGVRAYTERITTDRGERIRVRAGPFPSREAADEARDKLKAAGVTTALIPQ
ncbi:MAG: SPOR domain-containing protein [Burkholderiales bacterium]|nr:SPOR domain-containing protein [Burkholderiales bacterium]